MALERAPKSRNVRVWWTLHYDLFGGVHRLTGLLPPESCPFGNWRRRVPSNLCAQRNARASRFVQLKQFTINNCLYLWLASIDWKNWLRLVAWESSYENSDDVFNWDPPDLNDAVSLLPMMAFDLFGDTGVRRLCHEAASLCRLVAFFESGKRGKHYPAASTWDINLVSRPSAQRKA